LLLELIKNHAMKTNGAEVSGQLHSPAALLPVGKDPPPHQYPLQEAGWAPGLVWMQRLREKSFAPALVVHSSVSHYNDCTPQLQKQH
jgi:hypothetical protein